MKKHAILIVDDDADDREILRDAFLTHDGVTEYVFLENGDALMNYLHQHEASLPSLILLDLNMPGKDGREALKEIKSSPLFNQIPTVVFTTSSAHHDKKTSYNLGANLFITKPDTFNKLVELTASISRLWLQEG